jgi:hypothetical protein
MEAASFFSTSLNEVEMKVKKRYSEQPDRAILGFDYAQQACCAETPKSSKIVQN